jgi:hypothetical protein
MVAIAAFVAPPLDVADQSWTMFARFLVVVTVIVTNVVAFRASAERRSSFWLGTGLVTLVAACGLLVVYSATRSAWLVPFDGRTFITGRPYYSRDAQDALKTMSPAPASPVLADAALIREFSTADIPSIWPLEILERRRGWLILEYVATIELFALAVCTMVVAYGMSAPSTRTPAGG